MEPATTLAIIILVVAILVLVYYYLQVTDNPLYNSIHSQASGFSSKVGQEEYISNISEKMGEVGSKFRDRVQDEDDDEEHVSKTDFMSKKISQFIDEQSEQLIEDWDLATNKDIDVLNERFESLSTDLNDYKDSNDNRVDLLEERVNKIEEDLSKL